MPLFSSQSQANTSNMVPTALRISEVNQAPLSLHTKLGGRRHSKSTSALPAGARTARVPSPNSASRINDSSDECKRDVASFQLPKSGRGRSLSSSSGAKARVQITSNLIFPSSKTGLMPGSPGKSAKRTAVSSTLANISINDEVISVSSGSTGESSADASPASEQKKIATLNKLDALLLETQVEQRMEVQQHDESSTEFCTTTTTTTSTYDTIMARQEEKIAQRTNSDKQSHAQYVDLVAQKGANLFRQCTEDDSGLTGERSAASVPLMGANGTTATPPTTRSAKKLTHTPSMVMLNEAAELLAESPSAMIPMEAESTGGVYQLRRQKSVYAGPDDISVSSALSSFSSASTSISSFGGLSASGGSRRPRFFNSKKAGSKPLGASPSRENYLGGSPSLSLSSFRSKTLGHHHSKADLARHGSSLFTSSYGPGSGSNSPSSASGKWAPSKSSRSTRPSVRFSDEPSSAKSVPSRRDSSGSAPGLRRVKSHDSQSPDAVKANSIQSSRKGPALLTSVPSTVPVAAKQLKKRYKSKVAVFKPEDEETGAKEAVGLGNVNPERAGMVVGGGARRERAAYLLDKNVDRFSGVPETVLVYSNLSAKAQAPKVAAIPAGMDDDAKSRSASAPAPDSASTQRFQKKRGSLQRFCDSDGNAEDRLDLVRKASAQQVHALGILDMRIFNTDRHSANILCKKNNDGTVNLIPIDHALSLPNWHYLSESFFDWMFWPQAETPFDAKTLQVIDQISVQQDAEALRGIDIPEGCIATNTVCTLALKAGAKAGLTLKELGNVFQRPFCAGHNLHNKFISPLEAMIVEAVEQLGVNEMTYYPAGSRPTDEYLRDGAPSSPSGGEVDVSVKETQAFDNTPPSPKFYQVLKQVLESKFHDGAWRDYLHI